MSVPTVWRKSVMYSNLLVGVVAVGFMLGTYALLQLPVHLPLVVMGFCGTFVVYQLDRALYTSPEDAVNQPERVAWAQQHFWYVRVSTAIAAGVGLAMVPLVRPVTWLAAGVFALLGLLYVVPVGPLRLKALHLAKPLLIAVGWVVGGVLMPALQAGDISSQAVLALMIYRLGFVLPNVLLADWLDQHGDAREGILTPAIYLSGRTLRRISRLILGLTVAGALLSLPWTGVAKLLLVDALGPALMLGLLIKELPEKRWFYLVTLDAIVAWPGITALVYLWTGG